MKLTLKILVATCGCFLFSFNMALAETTDQDSDVKKVDADDEYKQDTLISNGMGIDDNGGYGAPVAKFGRILGKSANFAGLRGAWIINHKFGIGLAGYGLSNKIDFPEDSENRKLGLGYGGLILEYTPFAEQKVHLHSALLIGAGGLSKSYDDDDEDYDDDEKKNRHSPSDSFFVVEPEITVETNVTKWFRAGIGASYRYTNGAKLDGIKDSTISGLNALVMFRFGSF